MDPSALIFIAIAIAWAAYLIPKSLEHHEESNRSRGIDKFSHGLRILARREPLSRRKSTLVTVTDAARPAPAPPPVPVPVPMVLPDATPADVRAHRRAAAAAARRRRRILDLLLVGVLVVAALAIGGVVVWHWLGVPAGLVLVWLVLCRVSVRGERKRRPVLGEPLTATIAAVRVPVATASVVSSPESPVWVDDATGEVSAVLPAVEPAALGDGAERPVNSWEMMPFVVPTYVAKEQVRRSVRTIDLDSTGVWSSGRSEIDSALVRESDAAKAGSAARPDEVVAQDERSAGSAG